MDILDKVYEVLKGDVDNIKFYEYPEVSEVDDPKVVIDPLDSPMPADYADDEWLTLDFQLQIDVWSRNRKDTENIADKIRNLMWDKLRFHQNSGPKGYDSGVFRDARRYRGKLYRDDFDSL